MQLLKENFPNCKIAVAKELTKIYEQIIVGDISLVVDFFANNPDKIKGEMVIIIEKNHKDFKDYSHQDLEKSILDAIKHGKSLKDISQELSEVYSLNKKEIYQIALNLKNNL